MDRNIRYCNSCQSDNNWNYCCKMGIKNYIIDLEKQLEITQYNNEQHNNQINEPSANKTNNQMLKDIQLEFQTRSSIRVPKSTISRGRCMRIR